ncbi:ImuA family protein [Pedobacter sp. MC2016-24]|uniref:ImuA family protein n=1 Tax=Pedobacter sp. MC2016-24 TaxID=2780090 RepID=UPI0018820897|nr:Error-prone repair protein ImuA [Pedobacter sp. MC2016-24]MBE9601909.1 Error-prone repair protein ImuA [Pedobacter sp. MC2016-24]
METKLEMLNKLRQDMLLWQGFKPAEGEVAARVGLGEIEAAFPGGVFPRKGIHEFICETPDQVAATDGFVAGLLSVLMAEGTGCVWISTSRRLFPPSLAAFNVETDQIIFVDVRSDREALWVMEEALRCDGLAAVVAEVDGLSLVESRRLQLAVERQGIPGLIIRKDPQKLVAGVSTARWKIAPLPSGDEDGMPGVGFPRWQVQLLKVRSGNPGSWTLEWEADRFLQVTKEQVPFQTVHEKVG